MPKVSATFLSSSAEVHPGNRDQVRVEITDGELDEIISSIGIPEILDEIGEEACRTHFGIEEGD